MFLEMVVLVVSLLVVFYVWATFTFDTFKKRGIPYEKPKILLGNMADIYKSSFLKEFVNFYNRNKHQKIVGYFSMRVPFFVITDPDLIKNICVKDFDHFRNHHPFLKKPDEPMADKMLINLCDQTWKDMRNTLTPAFTAAKMRTMFTLMEECFGETLKYLKSLSKNGTPFDLEMKDCFNCLSNDIIASTAFGIKVNSYEDRNNEFYKIGETITKFRSKRILKIALQIIAPWLTKLTGLKLFDSEKSEYFMRLVCDAMKHREENHIYRPDMIQLLMEAKRDSTKQWTDADLAAQCFIFFFAAFENNSNLLCFTCFELMQSPQAQERLYEEVLTVHKELQGDPLSYDVVNKMQYLDMVVSEVLRKWTFALVTDRVCTKDCKMFDEAGSFIFEFKKGDIIWIPLIGLAMDDRFFKDPLKFKPERFSPENKEKIRPFTNIPFGAGPRSCVGNRYTLMQTKAMVYHLVLNYKIERSVKSLNNLFEDITGFTLAPKDGLWVRFAPRIA